MKVVSKAPLAVSLGLHLELVLSISASGLAFLSFHNPETSPNFPAQKYSSDISFPPRDSSETHERAFYSAAGIEIPYPPPPHTHTHTFVFTDYQFSLQARAAHVHTQTSAQQVPRAAAGAARSTAGSHRCVDSSGKTASRSPGCEVWEVVYKKPGMDVCQEVVNKLGALFFLWLSLQSLVCLWRRMPGCTGQIFQSLQWVLFFFGGGGDEEGL